MLRFPDMTPFGLSISRLEEYGVRGIVRSHWTLGDHRFRVPPASECVCSSPYKCIHESCNVDTPLLPRSHKRARKMPPTNGKTFFGSRAERRSPLTNSPANGFYPTKKIFIISDKSLKEKEQDKPPQSPLEGLQSTSGSTDSDERRPGPPHFVLLQRKSPASKKKPLKDMTQHYFKDRAHAKAQLENNQNNKSNYKMPTRVSFPVFPGRKTRRDWRSRVAKLLEEQYTIPIPQKKARKNDMESNKNAKLFRNITFEKWIENKNKQEKKNVLEEAEVKKIFEENMKMDKLKKRITYDEWLKIKNLELKYEREEERKRMEKEDKDIIPLIEMHITRAKKKELQDTRLKELEEEINAHRLQRLKKRSKKGGSGFEDVEKRVAVLWSAAVTAGRPNVEKRRRSSLRKVSGYGSNAAQNFMVPEYFNT